jgi:hypothetical protein
MIPAVATDQDGLPNLLTQAQELTTYERPFALTYAENRQSSDTPQSISEPAPCIPSVLADEGSKGLIHERSADSFYNGDKT